MQLCATADSFRDLPLGHVLLGDAFDLLDRLPEGSVDLIVTSPPYWGHREYGLGHNWDLFNDIPKVRALQEGSSDYDWYRRNQGVLGLEPYPEWYVSHLAEILSKAWRCLKATGNMWINVGDTYFARWSSIRDTGRQGLTNDVRMRRKTPMGGFRQEKQLLLLPSRFAVEMQSRGWILRNDLIWYKPNATPRPEGDRLKLAHEHFFHFVKKPREGRAEYYYDPIYAESRQNDVVAVNVAPGENGHTATFPRNLIVPRILTSSPREGVVLDPFCGTGRALEVGIELGRRVLGFELQASYQSAAQRKLQLMLENDDPGQASMTETASKGNFVSEWFGQRIHPSVRADLDALKGKNAGVCPFLSGVLTEKTQCIKNENSFGVCTVSSASNGRRQDWLVCPYRVINSPIVGESCRRIFGLPESEIVHPIPVSLLRREGHLQEFKKDVKLRGSGFLFFQDKLGGEISVLATDRSPEMAFDVTLVEILYDNGSYSVSRYGILEVQTMDFHGSYKHAVKNLQDALRLHPNDFPESLQQNESWAGEKVEGPNIANVFKRTFYQIMVKFQLSGQGAAAGTVLALPCSVWDSWQPFLGKPEITRQEDGTFSFGGCEPIEGEKECRSFIHVFDLDGCHRNSVSPVTTKMIVKVSPERLAHHAFTVVPAGMMKSITETDSILTRIRSRLIEWWPDLNPCSPPSLDAAGRNVRRSPRRK